MKYMFASDIHGSAHYCRKMLEVYRQSGADRLILLGDLLYHGPRNDLPQEYAPKQVIAMLNEYQQAVYEKISPYLTEEEKQWLKEETAKF